MVQKIKFVFVFFLVLSCSTCPNKPLSDSEKIKQIKNTYWQSDKIEEKRTFKKGNYEFETKIDGESCASCIESARMDHIVLGNLSESGEKEAVAVIYSQTGGSGVFIYLNLYVEKNGKINQSGFPIFLGDRVIVKKVSIKDKKVIVDLITQGRGEPLCCPTTKETRIFNVINGQLKKIKK